MIIRVDTYFQFEDEELTDDLIERLKLNSIQVFQLKSGQTVNLGNCSLYRVEE